MSNNHDYLVNIKDKKEDEAIRRLVSAPPIYHDFFRHVGLHPSFFWCILNLRTYKINSPIKGEIDILAGLLAWSNPEELKQIFLKEEKESPDTHPSNLWSLAARRLANSGGIQWPPLTDYLVAVEAKCAYLHPGADQISSDNIKSKKEGKLPNMRGQVEKLIEMGFDRIFLLDILVCPPVSTWISSAAVAQEAKKEMQNTFNERLPGNETYEKLLPVGHIVWTQGAVTGGNETVRGATNFDLLKKSSENPHAKSNSELRQKINGVLKSLPRPSTFPYILIDCQKCGHIHILEKDCAGI